MEVILLQKVRNLGDLGDRVKVRAGFGRNYLLPQGMALPATPENVKVFEARRAELEKSATDSLNAAQRRAQQLEGYKLTIKARAAEEGKLYGSVGIFEIIEALKREGITVQKREITLPSGPIRQTGEHTVLLQLHSDVEVSILVIVEEEKEKEN
jgi:large subunit ribosomal protein L9